MRVEKCLTKIVRPLFIFIEYIIIFKGFVTLKINNYKPIYTAIYQFLFFIFLYLKKTSTFILSLDQPQGQRYFKLVHLKT